MDGSQTLGGAPVTGGTLLARLLGRYGIDVLMGMYGETGALISEIFERERRYQGPLPRYILVRDERTAPYAAISRALLTGRVIALDAGGPSVASPMMTAGLGEARNMSIPVLVLVTETAETGVRRFWGSYPQSFDQVALLAPLLKHYAVVREARLIPEHLRYALAQATTGRPGPVALFLPADVLEANASDVDPGAVDPRLPTLGAFRTAPDPQQLPAAVDALIASERPLILAGGGVILSGASASVVALAERLAIPVATTITGSGVIDEGHRLAVGVPGGVFGTDVGVEAMTAADLIVMIGAKSSASSTMYWSHPGPGQRSIHLDVDPTEPGRIFPDAIRLVGDARLGVDAILQAVGDRHRVADPGPWLAEIDWYRKTWRAWLESTAAAAGPVPMERVMLELEARIRGGDVLVTDASNAAGWGTFMRLPGGSRRISCRGLGTLGSSLGLALGACLALPGARVVQLTGDGGHAYHIGELSTFVRLGLKVVTIVNDNGTLGTLQYFEGFPAAAGAIGGPDYAGIARASGWTGITVTDPGEVGPALDAAFAASGPVLLHVHTSPNSSPRPFVRPKPIEEARRAGFGPQREAPAAGQA